MPPTTPKNITLTTSFTPHHLASQFCSVTVTSTNQQILPTSQQASAHITQPVYSGILLARCAKLHLLPTSQQNTTVLPDQLPHKAFLYHTVDSLTLPSAMAEFEAPSRIFEAAVLKASKPRMGKYSWLSESSSASSFSTFLTTGSTHGLPSSVR